MQTIKKEHIQCGMFAVFFAAAFLLFVFLPQPEYFGDERRQPAKFPEISVEALLNGNFMSRFEKYATDAVPLRGDFRRLKALSAIYLFQRKDNHGIYVKDGYAAKMEYPMKEANLVRAAGRFRHVYETHLGSNNRVFFSVIPDKNFFLAKETGHLQMDYGKLESVLVEKMPFAKYIPIFDLLEIGDYYRTDTHWRQEKIMDVAKHIAKSMGTELNGEMKQQTANPRFYGVYYGQSGLPMPPEELSFLAGQAIDKAEVYDYQNSRHIGVYDQAAATGRDGYEMFLSGPLSILRIDNPNAPVQKKLVIFRDSFGSSIAPLFLSGYSRIYLADIRYIHPDRIGKFIDFTDSDVLFLYSTLVLNNSETIK